MKGFFDLFRVDDEMEKAVVELIHGSRIDLDYIFMLCLSAAIITLGFVLGELPVLIGGMIIAPLLFPLLAFSNAVLTLSFAALRRSLYGILSSMVVVILTSYFTTFFLKDVDFRGSFFLLAIRPHPLSFLVAFFSGLSAAYSWISPKLSSVLPGVATAVSLVPPLVVSGIALHLLNKKLFLDSLLVFGLNAFGVMFAGFLVFLIFGLRRFESLQEKAIKEEE